MASAGCAEECIQEQRGRAGKRRGGRGKPNPASDKRKKKHKKKSVANTQQRRTGKRGASCRQSSVSMLKPASIAQKVISKPLMLLENEHIDAGLHMLGTAEAQ